MKGYPLIIAALVAVKEQPLSIRQIGEQVGVLYIPSMYLVRELEKSGLIVQVGRGEKGPHGGYGPALYGFNGFREAQIVGRGFMRSFLRVWNALQHPSTADEVAEECERSPNYVRKKIAALRKAHLVYRSGWIRNKKAEPTCIFSLGSRRDSPRPKPLSEQEYNRRANAKRGQDRLIARDPWLVMRQQLSMAA